MVRRTNLIVVVHVLQTAQELLIERTNEVDVLEDGVIHGLGDDRLPVFDGLLQRVAVKVHQRPQPLDISLFTRNDLLDDVGTVRFALLPVLL